MKTGTSTRSRRMFVLIIPPDQRKYFNDIDDNKNIWKP